jgi:transcriptional regulator with XRE-family HTH domain
MLSLVLKAANVIRDVRRTAGLTQASLASRIGVPQSVIARLERPGSNPTWDTMTRILDATNHRFEMGRSPQTAVGLDLGQLRERLALSPAERLRSFEASQHNLIELLAKTELHAKG